ncbi:head GIN domain-containing protein [Massilia sp. LXY-6]|uniref:head GIN domain-containing protein n=1 Tax=Massilia sp. LXY-6 TaxID=3379823 RepID=UPI003EE02549
MTTTNPRSPNQRRRLLAACALAFAAGAMTAPALAADWSVGRNEQVQGNGNIKRQAREVGHFNGLAFSLPGQVEIRSGNSEGLSIETDDNLLPLIETVVEDGTLKIRNKNKVNIQTRHLKIVVQARELDRLALAGSGNIDADRVTGTRVKFDVGGSGSIKVRKAEGESISVNLGGSGDLKVDEGRARSLSASIGGSGTVDMARVRLENASVTVAGSGDATLWVRDSLSMTIAGSGDVSYYGDPQVSKAVVGSGNARRLGAAPR